MGDDRFVLLMFEVHVSKSKIQENCNDNLIIFSKELQEEKLDSYCVIFRSHTKIYCHGCWKIFTLNIADTK